MTEVIQQNPYLEQLEEVTEETIKSSLEQLYEAGYVDFEENKIMIESNPEMELDDIMACLDESKKDDEEATKLVDLEDDGTSDVAAGEYNEKDIEEMNALVGEVVDSVHETDPEEDNDDDKKGVIVQALADVDAHISTGTSSKQKQSDSEESKDSKSAVTPFDENSNVENKPKQVNAETHKDPNLYVVRKKPKRAAPGT